MAFYQRPSDAEEGEYGFLRRWGHMLEELDRERPQFHEADDTNLITPVNRDFGKLCVAPVIGKQDWCEVVAG